jgi:hypothetical protein
MQLQDTKNNYLEASKGLVMFMGYRFSFTSMQIATHFLCWLTADQQSSWWGKKAKRDLYFKDLNAQHSENLE